MYFAFKKKVQKIIVTILVVVTALSLLDVGNVTALAYNEKAGTITGGNPYVYTRVEASDSSERVNTLENGKPVTVIGEKTGDDGKLWYYVRYNLKANGQERKGYCRAVNVSINGVVQTPEYEANATVIAKGTITGTNVYVRDGAGTSGTTKLVALDRGHQIDIIGETTVGGAVWYKHNCTKNGVNYTGWTHGSYVSVEKFNYTPDANFEQNLRNAGFPESYIPKLSALRAQYPNWVFEPVKTGLDWQTVISNESYAGRNLVYKTEDDAKKSYANTEYNWYTNTWTIRDASGWVTAHPDFIAYCMDPRNFLNATNIFMFESLSYSNIHNIAGVNAILNGTFMAKEVANGDGTILNYANAFMSIGQATNVSPYHLASRVRQEQGTEGTSAMISGKYSGYEGYYNYFNIGTYGTGNSLYTRGLSHAKSQGWNTRYKSLLGGAQFVAKSYIGVGQDTLYTQKFDVIAQGGLYTHQYMTNVQAAISESKSVAKAYTDKTQIFVFKIPVYNNMPSEPVSFTASGNRNNFLKSLSIAGLSLTPSFDGAKTSYSVIVGNGVSSITISAAPVVSSSKVSGTGTYSLAEGANTRTVTCKSQSGDTRTYTLNIFREPSGSQDYTLSSDKYNIGTYITGVGPQTKAADLVAGIRCEGGSVKVLTADGKENTGVVGTGNKLAIYVNGNLTGVKEVAVRGDISGDGAITIADLVRVNRHTLNISTLSGYQLSAADVNNNGSVNIQDLVLTNRHILGIAEIK